MTEPVRTLFIAGPTASGKSALALALAQRLDGEVINADSMQVYADLRILTARPTDADEASAPHRLYGVLDGDQIGSVAWWRDAARAAVAAAHAAGRTAILVGGTGLYIKALTDGLSDVPDPGEPARAEAKAILDAEGIDGLRARAETLDPLACAAIQGADTQRLLRLVSVALGTGAALSSYRDTRQDALDPQDWRGLVILPARDVVLARIAARASGMLRSGAVEEAARLSARGLSPDRPATRAIGVAALSDLAAGRATEAEARERLIIETRRYAKRQSTWFRNQTPDWPRLAEPDLTEALKRLHASDC